MSKGYGPRRNKLKNHDAGHDRHTKGLAQIRKQRRQEEERARFQGANRSRRKRQEPVALPEPEPHAEHCQHWFDGSDGCCFCNDWPIWQRMVSVVMHGKPLEESTECGQPGTCKLGEGKPDAK
jgi:hypothetical protein